MDLNSIQELLQSTDYLKVYRLSEEIKGELAMLKSCAVARNDQVLSAKIWSLEKVHMALHEYYSAFILLKEGKYFDSWGSLERYEIESGFVRKKFPSLYDEFHFPFFQSLVMRTQSLFPYEYFGSTEILRKEVVCSICKTPLTPRNRCEHVRGEIYDGESCGTIVTKAELVGMAMTRTPAHRFGVIFATDSNGNTIDNYNYGLLEYLANVVQSPFDNWEFEKTKIRNPHSRYKKHGVNDKCPCGSMKKYKKCCLKEAGVLMDHYVFHFPPYLLADVEARSSKLPKGIFLNQTQY